MQILRLSGSTPRPWVVELNPRLTVVDGTAPEAVAPLLAAIDGILRARLTAPELAAAGLDGVLRIGDQVVGLATAAPRLAALVPSTPLTAADLTGADHAAGAMATAESGARLDHAVRAAREACDRAATHLEATRAAWERSRRRAAERARLGWSERATAAGALHAAQRRVAAARAALDAAAAPAPPGGPPRAMPSSELGSEIGVAADHDALVARAAQRVDAVRAARQAAADASADSEARGATRADDAVVRDELARTTAELAEAERWATKEPPPAASPEVRRALTQRRDALTSQLDDLQARAGRVRAAVAAAEAHRDIDPAAANRLALEWERARDLVAHSAPPTSRRATSGAHRAPGTGTSLRRRAAQDRVALARRALANVEGTTPLDPADVEALEAAHALVLESWAASERRVGAARARRRLEEAQLSEREVLARLGFASYTDFMVSGRAAGLPSLLDAEQVRRNLVAAERALAALEVEESTSIDGMADAGTVDPAPEWPHPTDDAGFSEALAAAGAAPLDPDDAPPHTTNGTRAAPSRPVSHEALRWTEPWDAAAAKGRLASRSSDLRARAAAMLGQDPGDDVASRLRELATSDPLSELRLILAEVGVTLAEGRVGPPARARALEWLEGEAAADQDRLAAELAEVEARLGGIDSTARAHEAWREAVEERDARRAAVARLTEAAAARRAVEEEVAAHRAEVARATADLTSAEAALERADAERTTVHRAAREPRAGAEAELREAQLALDVARSRLAPFEPAVEDEGEGASRAGAEPSDHDPEDDVDLGAAEARFILARAELAGLEEVRSTRSELAPAVATSDVDAVVWRVLARLAAQRRAAADGGCGPAPLLVVEPFAEVGASAIVEICEALVGPASSVQTVLMTARSEAVAWAAAYEGDEVSLGAVAASPPA